MQAYFVIHIGDTFRSDNIIPVFEGNNLILGLGRWDIPTSLILLEKVVIY